MATVALHLFRASNMATRKLPSPTNNVHSPEFQSKLDPYFKGDSKDGANESRKTGIIGGYRRRSIYLPLQGSRKPQ